MLQPAAHPHEHMLIAAMDKIIQIGNNVSNMYNCMRTMDMHYICINIINYGI